MVYYFNVIIVIINFLSTFIIIIFIFNVNFILLNLFLFLWNGFFLYLIKNMKIMYHLEMYNCLIKILLINFKY